MERCALSLCQRALVESDGAYLFKDLETGKLVVFCDDCARDIELNHRQRFVLVAL